MPPLMLMLMSGPFLLHISAVMPPLMLMLMSGPSLLDKHCYASAYVYAYVRPAFIAHKRCYAPLMFMLMSGPFSLDSSANMPQ